MTLDLSEVGFQGLIINVYISCYEIVISVTKKITTEFSYK